MPAAFKAGLVTSGNSADFAVSLLGLSLAPDDFVMILSGYNKSVGAGAGITSSGWNSDRNGATATSGLNKTWYDVSFKKMGATPDTSVTVKGSTSATTPVVCVIQAFTGVDTTTPMDVPSVYVGTNGVCDPGAITPITTGSLVVAASIAAVNGAVPAAPSGYSNLTGNKYLLTLAEEAAMASKSWSGSGAEDPGLFTLTTLTSFAVGNFTYALRAAPTFVVVNQANPNIAESGNDQGVTALWVPPANVQSGVVYGPTGTEFTGALAAGGSGPLDGLTTAELNLLEAVVRLHGLIDPLVVSATSRGDGTVIQSLSGAGPVTVHTTELPTAPVITKAELAKLARWYGLIDDMVEDVAARSDGTLSQTVTTTGGNTTVTTQ